MFKNLRFIYITTENRDEARKIGNVLVSEKLAACVNIIDGMESIYTWEDSIKSGTECILIAKTTYSNVERLTQRVKEIHSYDVPCVVSINLAEQEGNAAYLDWILHSVRPATTFNNPEKTPS